MLEIVAWVFVSISSGHYNMGNTTVIERFDHREECHQTMKSWAGNMTDVTLACNPVYKFTDSYKLELEKAKEENDVEKIKELTFTNSIMSDIVSGQTIQVDGKEIKVTNVRKNDNFVYINGERFVKSKIVVIVE